MLYRSETKFNWNAAINPTTRSPRGGGVVGKVIRRFVARLLSRVHPVPYRETVYIPTRGDLGNFDVTMETPTTIIEHIRVLFEYREYSMTVRVLKTYILFKRPPFFYFWFFDSSNDYLIIEHKSFFYNFITYDVYMNNIYFSMKVRFVS